MAALIAAIVEASAPPLRPKAISPQIPHMKVSNRQCKGQGRATRDGSTHLCKDQQGGGLFRSGRAMRTGAQVEEA
jgi:hypothetical protein